MAQLTRPLVLVLDAVPADLQPVRQALMDLGCRTEYAGSPGEGLSRLLNEDFDLVLVGAAMPQASGIRFVQDALRIRPWVQFLTLDNRLRMILAESTPAGTVDYLPSPPVAEDLRARVDAALVRRKRMVEEVDTVSLNRILGQLASICLRTQNLFAEEVYASLLQGMCEGISETTDSAASGVLEISDDGEPSVIIRSRRPVSPWFLQRLGEDMLACHESITGKRLSRDTIPVRHEAGPVDEKALDTVGSILSIPIVHDKDLRGVLTFASETREAYSAADLSFLYHVANRLSVIFPTLQKIRRLAVHDSLTGLYNRRYFEGELRKTWLLTQRYANPMGLLVIDVDGLKTLNDSYGHLTGDAILEELSQVVLRTARATDTVARYGGDEMVVILPNADARQSESCAHRILSAVSEHVFCRDKHPLHLSVSIGVSTSVDPGVEKESDLFTLADRAVFLAKENGRGQVCTTQQLLAQRAPRERSARELAPAEPVEEVSPDQRGLVLIVDDEPAICQTFEAMLADKFEVLTTTSAHEAIRMVQEKAGDIDLIMTDLRMPEMDGIELLEAVRKLSPDIVTIVVTGFSSTDNAIAAMRVGAYDFVRKPVDFGELEFVIKRGVERRRLQRQVEDYRQHLESMLDQRTKSLREAFSALEGSYMATMEVLSKILAVRESTTAQHDNRVGEYSVFLARRLNVSDDEILTIRRGALLHDIGKIGIPDSILLKPGPLTPDEWTVMKQHPVTGYQILSSIPFLKKEAEMVYSHHERYDGRGYPRGLNQNAICLGARIFALADAFDAMRSDRVYRKALPLDRTVEEIRKSAGTQFDPAVVDAFLRHHQELDSLFS